MKNTGNISKILDKVREEYVSVPKYLIHNALRDASLLSEDKFNRTMSTIINAVMLAAPDKKERVGFTILEYCVDENKQLNDDQYVDLIGCFVSNNYYMKCMYQNHKIYDIFTDVYPNDKLRDVYKYSIKNLGKSKNYKQCFTSKAKALAFTASFFLYSKVDYEDAVDILVKEKGVDILSYFLLEIVGSDNNLTDTVSMTIYDGGYRFFRHANSKRTTISHRITKNAPRKEIIKYAVDNYFTNLNSRSKLLNKIDPLLDYIEYKKKVVFIDNQGNMVGSTTKTQ